MICSGPSMAVTHVQYSRHQQASHIPIYIGVLHIYESNESLYWAPNSAYSFAGRLWPQQIAKIMPIAFWLPLHSVKMP